MKCLEELKAVLCDPKGQVSIVASPEDCRIIQESLREIEIKVSRNNRISNSCVPHAVIEGSCCGVLFSRDNGEIECNECGKRFDVKPIRGNGK